MLTLVTRAGMNRALVERGKRLVSQSLRIMGVCGLYLTRSAVRQCSPPALAPGGLPRSTQLLALRDVIVGATTPPL